jgi:hypothetical protein
MVAVVSEPEAAAQLLNTNCESWSPARYRYRFFCYSHWYSNLLDPHGLIRMYCYAHWYSNLLDPHGLVAIPDPGTNRMRTWICIRNTAVKFKNSDCFGVLGPVFLKLNNPGVMVVVQIP